MAKHGVLYETDNFIKNCINRGGVAEFDIDGGTPIVEGGVNSTDKELYNLSKVTSSTKKVGIAYNPSVKYDVIGGNLFPAKSLDDRDYFNPSGKVVDYFIPQADIEFGVTMDNIDGSTEPTVGKFLEPKATTTLFEIKSSQTADTPSFEVIDIKTVKYPTFDFTEEAVKVFVVKTRFNG